MPAIPHAIPADGDTLLTYSMLTDPDPLQAAGTGAILTLVASNSGSRVVTCASIVVTCAVGANAKDLLPNSGDGGSISTQTPTGWSAANDGGVITLTPSGSAGQIGADSVSFVFGNVTVNDQAGLTLVTIDETASTSSQPSQDRTATIGLAKFPAQFAVSELNVSPLEVNSGDSAQLMWTGSAATYTMEYDPGSGFTGVIVGNVGPYTAPHLTRIEGVIFTLVVSVTVVGQDAPLITQRQASVAVIQAAPVIQQFSGVLVQNNSAIALTWLLQGAEACTISGYPYALNPQGGTITLPQSGELLAPSYTLTAQNGGGSIYATVYVTWGEIAADTPVSYQPLNIAISPDDSYVFVGDFSDNYIYVLSATSYEQVGSPMQFGSAFTMGMAVSPDSKTLFAAKYNDGTLLAIDAKEFTLQATITVGVYPGPVVVAPDGSAAFVGLLTNQQVVAVDATSLAQTSSPQLAGEPISLAVTADSTTLYVAISEPYSVVALDTQTMLPIGSPIMLGAPPECIAVTPDDQYLVVVAYGYLQVYDLKTLTWTETSGDVGRGHNNIAVTPDNAYIIVPSSDIQAVVVLDAQTFTIIQPPITVGSTPLAVAVAPDSSRAFIVNAGSGSVSILGRNGVGGSIG